MICPMLGAAYTLTDAAIVIAASKMLKYFLFIRMPSFLSSSGSILINLRLLYNKAVEKQQPVIFFHKING